MEGIDVLVEEMWVTLADSIKGPVAEMRRPTPQTRGARYDRRSRIPVNSDRCDHHGLISQKGVSH